jgi:formate/nitrite transporter FocA (FNT family)
MAWVDRKITTGELLRNWSVVYLANFAGSLAAALMVWGGDIYGIGSGNVAATAIAIAEAKG